MGFFKPKPAPWAYPCYPNSARLINGFSFNSHTLLIGPCEPRLSMSSLGPSISDILKQTPNHKFTPTATQTTKSKKISNQNPPYPLIHRIQIHLKSKSKPKHMQATTSDLNNQIQIPKPKRKKKKKKHRRRK